MIVFIFCWLLIVIVAATPICFGAPSNQCVELTSFVASASMRSNFVSHCNGGNGFWPSDCQTYAERIADLFGAIAEVPDLASLLDYTEGYAFGANNALRKQSGQNVDAWMQYAIEMIASGISVMRRNRTVQLSTNEVYGGWAASYRGENYANAPCQYGSGQPSFELLDTNETLWAFSSSSLSLQYAQSWPWQHGSPRVIVMARNVSNVDSGGPRHRVPACGVRAQDDERCAGGTALRLRSIVDERREASIAEQRNHTAALSTEVGDALRARLLSVRMCLHVWCRSVAACIDAVGL